jgi:hypothetical protein
MSQVINKINQEWEQAVGLLLLIVVGGFIFMGFTEDLSKQQTTSHIWMLNLLGLSYGAFLVVNTLLSKSARDDFSIFLHDFPLKSGAYLLLYFSLIGIYAFFLPNTNDVGIYVVYLVIMLCFYLWVIKLPKTLMTYLFILMGFLIPALLIISLFSFIGLVLVLSDKQEMHLALLFFVPPIYALSFIRALARNNSNPQSRYGWIGFGLFVLMFVFMRYLPFSFFSFLLPNIS